MRELIKITKPTYTYFQLTPNIAVRNYSTDKILSMIGGMYKSLFESIHRIDGKIVIESGVKISYFIYLEREMVSFYLIVPDDYRDSFKKKINDVWNNKIDITIVPKLPKFMQQDTKYFLDYKKESALSLSCDRRDNDLLRSLFTNLSVMQDGDRLGIFYNFFPTDQRTWRAQYKNTMERLKANDPVSKNKSSIMFIIHTLINKIIDILDDVLCRPHLELTQAELCLSNDTIRKRESSVVETQIICMSHADTKKREKMNALTCCDSFRVLDGDNELIPHRLNGDINYEAYRIQKARSFKAQGSEGQSFISLPGRELLAEYRQIQRIGIQQTEVPEELTSGVMCLGVNEYKGNTTVKAYLPVTPAEKFLSLTVCGPTRSGKTTFLANIAANNENAGECVVVFDFCGHCQLSDAITKKTKHVMNIRCDDFNMLQGLGYNEIPDNADSPEQAYQNAKVKAMQLLTLINSVNSDDRELKAKMNRYLKSAAYVVFISGGDAIDVFRILSNEKLRYKYINGLKKEYRPFLQDYIDYLSEIDEKDKNGEITGTKSNAALAGINDRLDILKSNTYMELMLKKSTKDNFNLVEEFQKNQVICFRMPEMMFPTAAEKDTYCVYWMTKIWLALKMREASVPDKKRIPVNIYIDELYQVQNTERYVNSILAQIAKFSGKMIFSCHYINQMSEITAELKSASSSYILISGCDKQNYKELQEELEPYTVNDLLGLKQHTALNLIKVQNGYEKFVTKLPPP